MDVRLLLDTHVWIWFVEGDARRLSRGAIEAIENAAGQARLLASAVSAWEIALLVARGRLALGRELKVWIATAVEQPGIEVVPLDPFTAIASVTLPDLDDHGDPADRFLLATARRTGARLVTCDERLIRYGTTGHVSILDARP